MSRPHVSFLLVDSQGQIRSPTVGCTTEIGMRLRLWWVKLIRWADHTYLSGRDYDQALNHSNPKETQAHEHLERQRA